MKLFLSFNIDNNHKYYWASDPHIRVISEGSCDTGDWSNDAGNSEIKLHFTKYSHRKQLF